MIQYIEGLFVIRHWAQKQFKNLTIKKPSIFFGSGKYFEFVESEKGLRIFFLLIYSVHLGVAIDPFCLFIPIKRSNKIKETIIMFFWYISKS
jgi:hypothetical protein